MTDWNEIDDVGFKYKGYFQIYDNATTPVPFRFKELQEVTITIIADTEKHYSDDGTKSLTSLGDSSTFSFTTKKTADLWSTSSTSNDVKTISYFQNLIINDRLIPLGNFEGVQETEASENKFIVRNFNAFVLNIEDTRLPSTGVPAVVISGEIKNFDKDARQAAAPT